jgi:RNA-directed DNA polymerase
MMNEQGKSDGAVVPAKSPNKAGIQPAAEGMEGSALAKGNSTGQNTHRIQGRERVQNALGRVRQVAVRERKLKFTSLMHHIASVDTLREAYFSLKRDAASGVDALPISPLG